MHIVDKNLLIYTLFLNSITYIENNNTFYLKPEFTHNSTNVFRKIRCESSFFVLMISLTKVTPIGLSFTQSFT